MRDVAVEGMPRDVAVTTARLHSVAVMSRDVGATSGMMGIC